MFLQLDNLDKAVNKIEKNQIVGIPTETVYGIGVNPNSQVAVENLFKIKKRDEKTLGELFCFFILETILIGQSMNLNPYDQPAVELIKKETKKILF